jgi:hypothetical protein
MQKLVRVLVQRSKLGEQAERKPMTGFHHSPGAQAAEALQELGCGAAGVRDHQGAAAVLQDLAGFCSEGFGFPGAESSDDQVQTSEGVNDLLIPPGFGWRSLWSETPFGDKSWQYMLRVEGNPGRERRENRRGKDAALESPRWNCSEDGGGKDLLTERRGHTCAGVTR